MGRDGAGSGRALARRRGCPRKPARPKRCKVVARMSAAICGKQYPGFRSAHPGYKRAASMGKKLTDAQIEHYPRDGFGAEQARRCRRAMEDFEAAQGTQLTKGHNFKPHLLFTWVDKIVHSAAVLDAVEDVIGPDLRLFHLSVWPKDAGDPAYVSWHQDATYFGLEPPVQVTAWVALTDASIEAGCMEVIPGSHKLGQLHHAEHDA